MTRKPNGQENGSPIPATPKASSPWQACRAVSTVGKTPSLATVGGIPPQPFGTMAVRALVQRKESNQRLAPPPPGPPQSANAPIGVTQRKEAHATGRMIVQAKSNQTPAAAQGRSTARTASVFSQTARLSVVQKAVDEPDNSAIRQEIKNLGRELRAKFQAVKAGKWNRTSLSAYENDLRRPRNNEKSEDPGITQAEDPVITHTAFSQNTTESYTAARARLQSISATVRLKYDTEQTTSNRWDEFVDKVNSDFVDYRDNGGNRGRNNNGEWKINNAIINALLVSTGTGPSVHIPGLSSYTWQISDSGVKALHRPVPGRLTFVWHWYG